MLFRLFFFFAFSKKSDSFNASFCFSYHDFYNFKFTKNKFFQLYKVISNLLLYLTKIINCLQKTFVTKIDTKDLFFLNYLLMFVDWQWSFCIKNNSYWDIFATIWRTTEVTRNNGDPEKQQANNKWLSF